MISAIGNSVRFMETLSGTRIHNVIRVDVSAFSHPFYTGRTKVLDTEGRVERFKKRYAAKASAK